MSDRKAMEQALEALVLLTQAPTETALDYADNAIDALRLRLAQPEPDFYGYASRLAVAIWEQHYKDVAPQWKPLDDLIGVLTQIDNMTADLTRLARPEQEQEPVAWRHKDAGRFTVNTLVSKFPEWEPLYTAPTPRKPLTDEEIRHFWREATMKPKYTSEFVKDFARAIEAAHGIKGEA